MKKEKRVVLNQVFLMCHLVDQTMLIEEVIPKWEGKRVDSEACFYPSFAPNPCIGGRYDRTLFIEIVKNAISVTIMLNNFSVSRQREPGYRMHEKGEEGFS